MIRRPPRSTRTDTLFPYTTRFRSANISLKPIHGIGGDITADQMDVVADLAERYSFGEVRVTHAQNVVLPHVLKADLYAVWQALVEAGLADVNPDLVTDIIACPGQIGRASCRERVCQYV